MLEVIAHLLLDHSRALSRPARSSFTQLSFSSTFLPCAYLRESLSEGGQHSAERRRLVSCSSRSRFCLIAFAYTCCRFLRLNYHSLFFFSPLVFLSIFFIVALVFLYIIRAFSIILLACLPLYCTSSPPQNILPCLLPYLLPLVVCMALPFFISIEYPPPSIHSISP